MADNSPFEEIMGNLKNPENSLPPAEREKVRQVTGNVENSIKASLVNLLMSQFSKVNLYDVAVKQTMQMLIDRAENMEDADLISFMTTLSKVNATESKNLMDIFKKQDSDLKNFLKEIQKLSRSKQRDNGVIEYEADEEDGGSEEKEYQEPIEDLSPEKKEKLLQLIQKMNNKEMHEPNE